MQQGSKANFTGRQFESTVQQLLEDTGHSAVSPPRYEAVWGTGRQRNQTDKWLKNLDIQIELKYQAVPGTCDQKPFSELWNASQRVVCKQYILVLGGPHWDTPRGTGIYKEAKKMAALLNAQPKKGGAKKISVMKYSDFKEWVREQS